MKTDKKLSEKQKLELIEKRVEIRKKKAEVRKEQLNAEEMLYKRKSGLDEQKMLVNKTFSLSLLLSLTTIDEDRTILGSEPFKKPIFDKEERDVIAKKVLELVGKM